MPTCGIGHDLEGEGRERLAVLGHALDDDLFVTGSEALDRRQVGGAGQIGDHRVEKKLDTLVLEGGPAEDGGEVAGDGAGAHALLDLLGGQVAILEIGLEELLGGLGDRLEQLLPVFGGAVGEVGGDVGGVPVLPVVTLPDVGLHLDQVDDAVEVGLGPDRELEHERPRPEPIDDRLDVEVEVGAGAIELVDETDAGHAVTVGLAPHGLRLGLDSGDAVEHGNGPIEDTEGPLHLDREVDVTRGIDDVDQVLVPDAGGGGGGDGDATLLLLLHPVHRGGAFVDLTDLVVTAGVIEDALGQSGLARVDMSHDPDVSGPAQRHLAQMRYGSVSVAHSLLLLLRLDMRL